MLYKYFILPKVIVSRGFYESQGTGYSTCYKEKNITYTEYNYLRPGLSSLIKIVHFEMALRLTRQYFYGHNVIDFGCADGAFLPSLSKYFCKVMAIDHDISFIKKASDLAKEHGLGNVDLLCNFGMGMDSLRQKISGKNYRIVFLLETLEHIGDKGSMYQQKIALLRDLSDMISEDGFIVISVPKMVGPCFLLQRIGLKTLGLYTENISLKNLLKASFLYDTGDLEKQWSNGHLGFNHRKLEKCMRNEFDIIKKRDLVFQMVYVIKRKNNSQSVTERSV